MKTVAPLLGAAGLLAVPVFSRDIFPDCAKGPLANNTVCNPKATPSERAAALVKAMTIEEKLVNLVDRSLGAPRLGLPPYLWWGEALHGVAGSPAVSFARGGAEFASATSFSNPITLAAAFDDDLVEKIAAVISTEARAFTNAGRAGLDFWTPNINPYKDPRWGRGMETPGEDPLRIKGYVKALLKGLEGDGPIRKVIATCKHYAAYDLERWQGVVRYGFNAIVTTQDLSEYYLPPFQQCARDSNVGSIMCSYNALNGTPACASTYLMDDILRKHWGWTNHSQYITSDCNAIWENNKRGYYPSLAHSAAGAYNNGCDNVCEVTGYNVTDVKGAYAQGLLPNSTIDLALSRLYEGLARAGYFDPPASSPFAGLGWKDVNTPAAQALALQSAVDGIVLKKNADNLLPLDLSNKSVAIVGHWASGTRSMLGGYSGTPPYFKSPATAAKALNFTVFTASGPVAQNSSRAGFNDTWTAAALEAAGKADVVVYCGGIDMGQEGEDRDRTTISWPAAQLALLKRLAELKKPLVVAQLGGQLDDTPLLGDAAVGAVLWVGYPGQDGGTALFDIITGRTAPAGRLPVTQYPAGYVDEVPLTNMNLRPGQGNPGRTYRWYNKAILPFGHGLHYTTFAATVDAAAGNKTYAISDLTKGCTEAHKDLCPFPAVGIKVANTGKRTSDFVALAFLAGQYGPAPYPLKTLAAYKRVRGVKAGETATAKLEMNLGAVARTDESGNLVLYPGTYELLLDVPTQDRITFTLTGQELMLDKFPQPKPGNGTKTE